MIKELEHEKLVQFCLLLSIIFVLNPLMALIISFVVICKYKINIFTYNYISIIISLFFALLAFTQKTNVGDISRVYANIILSNNVSIADYFNYVDVNYYLFAIPNIIIYKLTGNVQYVSLFWVFIIYYLPLQSIVNILKYRGIKPDKAIIFACVFSFCICFCNFTQSTEIMKQAVVCSLFIYSYSIYLLGNIKSALLIMILSIGIHFSAFFFIPILFIKKLPERILLIAAILTVFFKEFNIFTTIIALVQNISTFTKVVFKMEQYEGHLDSFFDPSSLFFVMSYWCLIISTLFIIYLNRNRNSNLIKAVLAFIVILNLNYASSHNFTRMLTLLYPLYLLLYIELIYIVVKNGYNRMFLILIPSISLILNFRSLLDRIGDFATYPTSYMNNSLLDLMSGTIYSYLSFKI